MAAVDLVFTRQGLRELDRRAVEEYHIPILLLMEMAGHAVAEVSQRMLKPSGRVLILAGPGNNGGDGFAAARHLHNWGHEVYVLLLAPREKYAEAAAAQLAILEAMKLPVEVLSPDLSEVHGWLVDSDAQDLIVDALFGTGLSRPIEGVAAQVIEVINSAQRPILAVDIPSGLDADTGEPLLAKDGGWGTVVLARATVSFCGQKLGFGKGRQFTGEVTVVDIGAPRELLMSLSIASPTA